LQDSAIEERLAGQYVQMKTSAPITYPERCDVGCVAFTVMDMTLKPWEGMPLIYQTEVAEMFRGFVRH
jgi:hypothetical protein